MKRSWSLIFLLICCFQISLWSDVPVLERENFVFTVIIEENSQSVLEHSIPVLTLKGYGKTSFEFGQKFSTFAQDFKNPKIKNYEAIYNAVKKDNSFVGMKLSVELSPTKDKNVFNVGIKLVNSGLEGFWENDKNVIPVLSYQEINTNIDMFLDKIITMGGLTKKIVLDKNIKQETNVSYKFLLKSADKK